MGDRRRKWPIDWQEKPCTTCKVVRSREDYYFIEKNGSSYARGNCKNCHNDLCKSRPKIKVPAKIRASYTLGYAPLWEVCRLLSEHKVTEAHEILMRCRPGRRIKKR